MQVASSGSKTSVPTSPYASAEGIAAAIEELKRAFPDPKSLATDVETLKTYGSSEHSYHPVSPHAVVVRPTHSLHGHA